MSKPWIDEPHGRQLEAFVGAFQIKTSQFKTTRELVWFACRLFDLDPEQLTTVEAAAAAINDLGKKERSARAKLNRQIILPMDDVAEAAAQEATQGLLQRMMDRSEPNIVDGMDLDPAQLLRKVVSAVISAGHASDLYEFPDVLTFFGAQLPDDAS